MAVAIMLMASTPLFWLLGSPNTGQLVAASVQGAAGVAALLWAFLQASRPAPLPDSVVTGTGNARATGGGRASTGLRRRQEARDAPTRVDRTGDATAEGPGSSANTGIDFS
ncbi:hypothetical protein ACWDR0_07040 [Streptomyces sp. NPDC003691]